MKKKGWIILAVVVVVVLMLFSWFKGTYNDMVTRSEAVQAQWAISRTSISAAPT